MTLTSDSFSFTLSIMVSFFLLRASFSSFLQMWGGYLNSEVYKWQEGLKGEKREIYIVWQRRANPIQSQKLGKGRFICLIKCIKEFISVYLLISFVCQLYEVAANVLLRMWVLYFYFFGKYVMDVNRHLSLGENNFHMCIYT